MADMTRDQQRAELHKAIWGIADKLRGSVDGWDFKTYVLTTLFENVKQNFLFKVRTF